MPSNNLQRTTKHDYIDYSDITKEEFHSKRTVNPLDPTYDIRDHAGNPIAYGGIEGSSPKKLPLRTRGPISSNLNTRDIEGSQANTRGKGIFAKRDRETIRDTIGIQDIEGARPGTVQNGNVMLKVRVEIKENNEPNYA